MGPQGPQGSTGPQGPQGDPGTTEWETYHVGTTLLSLGQQVISWSGPGIVAIASLGPQFQCLSPASGRLISASVRTAGTVGGITLALYVAGASVESHVYPAGPSTIAWSASYAAGQIRELRLVPGLLATGLVDITCRWRSP